MSRSLVESFAEVVGSHRVTRGRAFQLHRLKVGAPADCLVETRGASRVEPLETIERGCARLVENLKDRGAQVERIG